MGIKSEQVDFINYTNFFKGNYKKGLSRFSAILNNPNQFKYFLDIEGNSGIDSIMYSNDVQTPKLCSAIVKAGKQDDIRNIYFNEFSVETMSDFINSNASDILKLNLMSLYPESTEYWSDFIQSETFKNLVGEDEQDTYAVSYFSSLGYNWILLNLAELNDNDLTYDVAIKARDGEPPKTLTTDFLLAMIEPFQYCHSNFSSKFKKWEKIMGVIPVNIGNVTLNSSYNSYAEKIGFTKSKENVNAYIVGMFNDNTTNESTFTLSFNWGSCKLGDSFESNIYTYDMISCIRQLLNNFIQDNGVCDNFYSGYQEYNSSNKSYYNKFTDDKNYILSLPLPGNISSDIYKLYTHTISKQSTSSYIYTIGSSIAVESNMLLPGFKNAIKNKNTEFVDVDSGDYLALNGSCCNMYYSYYDYRYATMVGYDAIDKKINWPYYSTISSFDFKIMPIFSI